MRIRSRLLKKRNDTLEEYNIVTSKRNMLGIKLPDSNEMGLKFIKHLIKGCSNKKLYGIHGTIETYSDSPEKTEIIEMLKAEFKKRNLEWIE
jgi:hypothetical protein